MPQRQVQDLDLVDPQTPGPSTQQEQTSESTQEIIRVNQQVNDLSRQIQSGNAVSAQQLAQFGNQAMAVAANAVQEIARHNPGRPINIGELHVYNVDTMNKAEKMNFTNNYGDALPDGNGDSDNNHGQQDYDSD